MPNVARKGDAISHGGYIMEGSPTVSADGQAVARLGDRVICALHGQQFITSASSTVYVNGRGVARIGDMTSCGATIISGSGKFQAG